MKYMLVLFCLFIAACDAAFVAVDADNETKPVALCWDYNPCSFDFYSEEYGCTYEQAPDGASCFDAAGVGTCVDGDCTHNPPPSHLRGDGAPCNRDSDCENNWCMWSMNEYGSGVCFSAEWIGCVAITEPVVLQPLCDVPRRAYVCGNYDATLANDCEVLGIGDAGETYYCCVKS